MEETPVVVSLNDVTKRFVIRREKSLKERLVNFGRSNLHKSDFMALDGISLDIRAGQTIGLIGPNGSGKSTLLKTIGGIIQPTTGTVLRRGRLAALLELGAGFHPDLTGRENVYLNASILGLSREQTDGYFDDIVEFSGIGDFIDTQVKFYSSGMYVRLAFAVAVHVDPDILIVDEVLAVGDEPFQRKCMDRIRQFQRDGKTIILVTHALDQVGDLCDRAIVLERGHVVFDGDAPAAIERLRNDFAAQNSPLSISATSESAHMTGVAIANRGDDDVLEGDRLDLAIDVAGVGDSPASVAMEIISPAGHLVFQTTTRMLGIPVAAVDGRATVEFHIEDLRLGPGRYQIQTAIGTDADGETHRDPQAIAFVVPEPMDAVGVVRPRFSATVR